MIVYADGGVAQPPPSVLDDGSCPTHDVFVNKEIDLNAALVKAAGIKIN
jgi:hypothetical protein